MREYFHAYHSILESIEPLDDAERGRLFTALLSYSATGETPLLTGNERFLFPALRGQIDRDRARYEERCAQNRRNGALGGRPPLPKPYAPQTPPKTKEKEKEKEKEKAISSTEEPVDGTQEARRFFAENFGPVSPYLGSRFAHYRALGIEEPLLVAALEEAARTSASAPWRYAEVILEECLARGCKTLADWAARRAGQRPVAPKTCASCQPDAGALCLGRPDRIADPRYLDELPVFRKRPPRGGAAAPEPEPERGDAGNFALSDRGGTAFPGDGRALPGDGLEKTAAPASPKAAQTAAAAGEEEPAAAAGNGAERTEKISSFGAGERSPMAFGTARSEGAGEEVALPANGAAVPSGGGLAGGGAALPGDGCGLAGGFRRDAGRAPFPGAAAAGQRRRGEPGLAGPDRGGTNLTGVLCSGGFHPGGFHPDGFPSGGCHPGGFRPGGG